MFLNHGAFCVERKNNFCENDGLMGVERWDVLLGAILEDFFIPEAK